MSECPVCDSKLSHILCGKRFWKVRFEQVSGFLPCGLHRTSLPLGWVELRGLPGRSREISRTIWGLMMLGRYQGQVEKSEKGGVIATRVNEFIFRVLKARKVKGWVKTLGAKQKSVGIGSSDEMIRCLPTQRLSILELIVFAKEVDDVLRIFMSRLTTLKYRALDLWWWVSYSQKTSNAWVQNVYILYC